MSRCHSLIALIALSIAPALSASAQVLFRAELTGAQEVPPVTTTASGLVTVALDGSTLVLRGSFDGLESDYNVSIGSHIHSAPAGANGSVVFPLTPTLQPDLRSGQWFGVENRFDLSEAQLTTLRSGNFYVNVHSQDNAGGELRGQILPAISLNEIRADQGGTDLDEYVEIAGPAGASLDGYSFVVLGDTGGDDRGVIEEVIDLSGNVIPDDGYFVFGQLTLATSDFEVDINLENGDSVTYLLVQGVPGSEGDDLDADDDGVLDSSPWSAVADAIGSADDDPSGATYGAQLGFEDIGPNGEFPAAHIFRNRDDAVWRIGTFDVATGYDTPGEVNASTSLVQIIHNIIGEPVEAVDIYVDGVLAVDSLVFREATPFVLLPASVPLRISIAENTASGVDDAFLEVETTLDGSPSYYIVATGARFDANQNDTSLALYDNARRASTTPGSVDLGFFNGFPGEEALDFRTGETQQAILFNDVMRETFSADTYQPIAAGVIDADLTTANNGIIYGEYDIDLTGLEGQTALLIATGEGIVPVAPFRAGGYTGALDILVVRVDGSTSLAENQLATAAENGPESGLSLDVANPVASGASIRYTTPTSGEVSLRVYDTLGRRVAVLAEGMESAGEHVTEFDASRLASGVYVLRLQAGDLQISRTVTVVR